MTAGHGWVDLAVGGTSAAFGAAEQWTSVVSGTGSSVAAQSLTTTEGLATGLRITAGAASNRYAIARHNRFKAWNLEALFLWRPTAVPFSFFSFGMRCSPLTTTSGVQNTDDVAYKNEVGTQLNTTDTYSEFRNGTTTQNGAMGTRPDSQSTSTWSWTRVRLVNDRIAYRIWLQTNPEPSSWIQEQAIQPSGHYTRNEGGAGSQSGDQGYIYFQIIATTTTAVSVDIARIRLRSLDHHPATLNTGC